jgi:hypothetical protein
MRCGAHTWGVVCTVCGSDQLRALDAPGPGHALSPGTQLALARPVTTRPPQRPADRASGARL